MRIPAFQHCDDQLIGYKLARLHDGFGPLTDFGAGLDLGAQHVARRDLRKAV